MPARQPKDQGSNRVALVSAVNTYLGFFVFVVLVMEAVFGGLALKTDGQIQLVALYSMGLIIAALIVVVALFAAFKPGALLQTAVGFATPEMESTQRFCTEICGKWWERIVPDDSSALSYVEIGPERATNTIKMKGRSYARDGKLWATWESIATCINPSERKVFYYWKGVRLATPKDPFEGFGEISFRKSSNQIQSGDGVFSDTNLTNIESTTKKFAEFARSTPGEERVMEGGDGDSIGKLIQAKIG
jgi:hypothetical protein